MAIKASAIEAAEMVNRGAGDGPVVLLYSKDRTNDVAYAFFLLVEEGKVFVFVFEADHEWCLEFMANCKGCQYPQSPGHFVELITKYWPDDKAIQQTVEMFSCPSSPQ